MHEIINDSTYGYDVEWFNKIGIVLGIGIRVWVSLQYQPCGFDELNIFITITDF